MAPSKAPNNWDDDDSDSTPPSSPPPRTAIPRRGGKFDDEEDESDVVESWDAEEDSEAEREKAKKEAEEKAKAAAQAQANKKSKSQRIEEHRMEKMRRRQEQEDDESSEEEDEASARERMRRMEKEADFRNAESLFGDAGSGPKDRLKPITTTDPTDPSKTVDLASLSIFNPTTREQFATLRETLAPLLAANSKKPQYVTFLTDFSKEISKELSSDSIKKIASSLTALSNERLKEEKAADKGGKKSKAAKTKTTLNASRNTARTADTTAYEDGLDDDDFM